MATRPEDFLAAASIFAQVDPAIRARLMAAAGLAPQPAVTPFAPPAAAAPASRPVAPQQSRPAGPGPLSQFLNRPQAPNEDDIVYNLGRAALSPFRYIEGAGNDMIAAMGELSDNPAKRAARSRAQQQGAGGGGGNAFPTSFKDPAYDAADAYASKLTGVPAGLLGAIRTRGERTNAGVRSVAGANTPYQITPETRQGIIKNYGIDPWSNPQNAALGAAYVLREQGGAPKTWDQQTALKAVGGYFGGAAGARNPFGGAADANGQTVGGYVQQVLGPNTGLPAPFLNAYNPAYDQQALGMVGAERNALMTPFSASVNTGPAPEVPKPEALPTTDFSKADAALEAMRPIEMSEKERMGRERDGFFKGIAQAMMSSPGNDGIGTFLMRLGGAALGGRMAARDDIRKEQDEFDDKMARFNAAVYQNEHGKAEVAHAEAAAQVQQNNEYNLNNWKIAYDRWTKNSSIDISGTNAVITQRDDKSGTLSVRTVPIQSAVDAAIARESAQVFQHMGGMQFAGNQQITSMTNALIGRAAISAMQGSNAPEADGGAAAAPAFYGTFIATHGLTGDLLGPDGAKSLEDNVTKQLTGMQLMPGSKEWIDRHDRLVATELAKLGLANPNMMQKMMSVGSPATSFQAADAMADARTSRRTDARGNVTETQTSPMLASDIFGQ